MNDESQKDYLVTPSAKYAFDVYQTELTNIFKEALQEAEDNNYQCNNQGRLQLIPQLTSFALSYYKEQLKNIYKWLLLSNEDSNFTYNITDKNKNYLAGFVSIITNKNIDEVLSYIKEAEEDQILYQHLQNIIQQIGGGLDLNFSYGRRLGWYAIVRAMKPKIVIETGVDKGMGACLLSLALLKNQEEGFSGRYFGTDIDPGAGIFYKPPYNTVGEILYGDSITTLQKFNMPIDVFINDSDHSAEYEAKEYETIADKLSPNAVLIGDNAHSTDALYSFALKTKREFLFFKEEPKDHWYPGAGIGFAFYKHSR